MAPQIKLEPESYAVPNATVPSVWSKPIRTFDIGSIPYKLDNNKPNWLHLQKQLKTIKFMVGDLDYCATEKIIQNITITEKYANEIDEIILEMTKCEITSQAVVVHAKLAEPFDKSELIEILHEMFPDIPCDVKKYGSYDNTDPQPSQFKLVRPKKEKFDDPLQAESSKSSILNKVKVEISEQPQPMRPLIVSKSSGAESIFGSMIQRSDGHEDSNDFIRATIKTKNTHLTSNETKPLVVEHVIETPVFELTDSSSSSKLTDQFSVLNDSNMLTPSSAALRNFTKQSLKRKPSNIIEAEIEEDTDTDTYTFSYDKIDSTPKKKRRRVLSKKKNVKKESSSGSSSSPQESPMKFTIKPRVQVRRKIESVTKTQNLQFLQDWRQIHSKIGVQSTTTLHDSPPRRNAINSSGLTREARLITSTPRKATKRKAKYTNETKIDESDENDAYTFIDDEVDPTSKKKRRAIMPKKKKTKKEWPIVEKKVISPAKSTKSYTIKPKVQVGAKASSSKLSETQLILQNLHQINKNIRNQKRGGHHGAMGSGESSRKTRRPDTTTDFHQCDTTIDVNANENPCTCYENVDLLHKELQIIHNSVKRINATC